MKPRKPLLLTFAITEASGWLPWVSKSRGVVAIGWGPLNFVVQRQEI